MGWTRYPYNTGLYMQTNKNLHRLRAPYVAVLNLPDPDLPHVRGVVPSVQTVSPSVDISLQCIRASQRTCLR
ncbi:hypothetical protein DPMN_192498 [Dreissena polymorpha]|uniref:Uncharacterized protein n=1 Tax=Dreissena polymorpha TaxID=45954 RepID=A0A9D3Y4T6_DREPO|nr:hypothetical protein DPMN_192498 [Dreissena polymorpha]